MTHVDDELADLVLGSLSPEQRQVVEAHLLDCERCQKERQTFEEAFAAVGLLEPPIQPSDLARARVMRAVTGPARFAASVDRVAALFDVRPAVAAQLRDRLNTAARW